MKSDVNKEYTTGLGVNGDEQQPPLYQVVLKNDDFTPMEFVVGLLEKFFYMDRRRAAEVMLEARMKGKAICGLFSKDYAEAKANQVIEFAQSHEHPLTCTTEAV